VDLVEKMTTFVRTVEAGSLAAAARQLRISSAAVSRQLAALENEMGAALVLRSTRRLSAARGAYSRSLNTFVKRSGETSTKSARSLAPAVHERTLTSSPRRLS
jgi:DNA-binding transcriptional LysR family regulator